MHLHFSHWQLPCHFQYFPSGRLYSLYHVEVRSFEAIPLWRRVLEKPVAPLQRPPSTNRSCCYHFCFDDYQSQQLDDLHQLLLALPCLSHASLMHLFQLHW
uniref:Uncharacterized protein n=1 Tax=Rhizophora mucronata TaxID=61149 RepID=A0A2P2LU23_RHIMU